MRSHTWTLILALCLGSLAAPAPPTISEQVVKIAKLSRYCNQLAKKMEKGKDTAAAPRCNLDNAVLPTASPLPLPPITPGLILKHVAIGRGTQNYTCDTNANSNATAPPRATGAKATLFNVSCIASTHPEYLAILPGIALELNNLSMDDGNLAPASLLYSGDHYFTNSTTPFFNLDTHNVDLGAAPCAKTASAPAPADAVVGQYNTGNGAVPWLKLVTINGATANIDEVYRVNTAGGNPPRTCQGIEGEFVVEYAAEYWFFGSL